LAYILLYILGVVGIWKSSLTLSEKSVLIGLGAAYTVHNIFVFDNLASYFMFFTMLGFIDSMNEGPLFGSFSKKAVRLDVVEYVVAPAALIAVVLAVYIFNVRPILANTRLIGALQSCSSQTPDASLFDRALSINTYVANQETREQVLACSSGILSGQYAGPTKQVYYQLAQDSIQSQVAATPKDARAYTLAGSFLNQASQFTDGQTYLEKAHMLSPGKQAISLELAGSYINLGNYDAASALLKQAYESATDNNEARNAYAISLVLSGHEDQAVKQFGDDPTIFNTVQMAKVYTVRKNYTKAIAIVQKLIAADPTNLQLKSQLAQTQYTAGMISDAIVTLRSIEKDHPEMKDQIEAAIKQVQQK
jgi:tetratricopeptide (TPR) repeat protein